MRDNIKKRDAEISKEKILNAAEELFSEKGYERTSLIDIGQKAEVSRATPTYFFKSKENLYREVVCRLIQDEKDFTNRFEIVKALDLKSALGGLINAHINFIVNRPAYVKILVREALDENNMISKFDEYSSVLDSGIELIEKAKSQGIIKYKIDSRTVLMNSLALCWFPIIQKRLILASLEFDLGNKEILDDYKNIVLSVLFSELERS